MWRMSKLNSEANAERDVSFLMSAVRFMSTSRSLCSELDVPGPAIDIMMAQTRATALLPSLARATEIDVMITYFTLVVRKLCIHSRVGLTCFHHTAAMVSYPLGVGCTFAIGFPGPFEMQQSVALRSVLQILVSAFMSTSVTFKPLAAADATTAGRAAL